MAKFHINPKTGNPNQCSAREGNCPFGVDEPHFDSKVDARSHYEENAESYVLRAREKEILAERYALEEKIEAAWVKVPGKYGPESRMNIPREDYDALVAGIRGSDDELTKIRRTLKPIPPLPEQVATGLMGLDAARREVFLQVNRPSYAHGNPDEFYFGTDEDRIMDEARARLAAGETVTDENKSGYMILPDDKLLNALTNENNGLVSTGQMNALLTFPEEHLAPVLNRLGVDNVSVAPFYNNREWGLAYTVMEPSGDTRSFSVYEHRNTDSIVVNGATNWDPVEMPYGPYGHDERGKNHFFAEFTDDSMPQVAETLGFFLKEAQNGELADDITLANQAEHRDWNAILTEQIPGFGAWAKKEGYEPKKRGFED